MTPIKMLPARIAGILVIIYLSLLFAFNPVKDQIAIPASVGWMKGDTVVLNYGTFKMLKIGDSYYTVQSPKLIEEDNKVRSLYITPGNGLQFFTPTLQSGPTYINPSYNLDWKFDSLPPIQGDTNCVLIGGKEVLPLKPGNRYTIHLNAETLIEDGSLHENGEERVEDGSLHDQNDYQVRTVPL